VHISFTIAKFFMMLSHAPVYLAFTSHLSILVSQILGLVENMSCCKCSKCGEKSYIFGEGGAQRTAEEMDMKLLGDVSESCQDLLQLAPIL
jgi:hypothetical protein